MGNFSRKLDDIFKEYSEEDGFERVLLKYKIQALLPHVKGPRALDLGCGLGFLCRVLSEQVEAVVGLDGSQDNIAKAQEINAAPNVTYACSLFESWSPPDGKRFNTLIATNILEHVEKTAVFFETCRKWLEPGGRLIITVPNALGLHKRIGKHMGLIQDYYALTEADLAKGHHRIYDREKLHAEVAAGGFEIVHTGGILLKPLSHKQMESWDPKTVEALYEIGLDLPDYCSSLIVVANKA